MCIRDSPYRYKMAAINSFCYRDQKCFKETESKDRELKTIKGIVRNHNYNTNIVDKVMKRVNIQKTKIEPEQKNYAGSLTYIGSHTRKIIKCFNKYGVDIACLLYTSRCV